MTYDTKIMINKNKNHYLLKYYKEFDHESEMSMLVDIIIPDIEHAEKVGSGKPLSAFTAEELESKLSELEIELNLRQVETYKELGEYEKARDLEVEIHLIQSMRNDKRDIR
jgi:hypothetical protein